MHPAPPAPPPEKIPLRSWGILLVLAAAGLVFYLDRQTLSILKPMISEDLGLSSGDFALLLNAYMIPYVLCYLVSGQIVDRLGSRFAGTAFLLIMAVSTGWSAFVQSKASFMGARALLGIGESGISPATMVMLALWFPASRRAFAMTTYQSLCIIGPTIAPMLIAWTAVTWGWRSAFIFPAILSGFVAVIWWLSDRNRPFEKAPEPTPSHPKEKGTFLRVLKWKPLWGLVAARVISDPFYFFIIYWRDGFLQEQAGWSLEDVGKYTGPPFLLIALANILVGMYSDRLGRKLGIVRARAWTLIGLACLAPLAFLTPFATSNGFIVLAMLVLLYLMANSWVPLSNVMVSELAPPGAVATAVGLLSAVSGAAAVAFTQFAGYLVDTFSYTPLFLIGGCAHPVAAAILWFCYLRPKNQIPAAPAAA